MARMILQADHCVPNLAIRGDLGWWRVQGYIDIMRLKFWFRILHLPSTSWVRRMYDSAVQFRRGPGRFRRTKLQDASWVVGTRVLLKELCLVDYWVAQDVGMSKAQWTRLVRAVLQPREEMVWSLSLVGVWPGEPFRPTLAGRYTSLKTALCYEPYLDVVPAWARRLLVGLRSGWGFVRGEAEGRKAREPVLERVCRACGSGAVDTVLHFLLYCQGGSGLGAVPAVRWQILSRWEKGIWPGGGLNGLHDDNLKLVWLLAMDKGKAWSRRVVSYLHALRTARAIALKARA